MNMAVPLVTGLLAGAAIGALYFYWLWWTLQDLVDRRGAGLWFAGNLMGRFAFALAGFGLLARWGGWAVLAAALGAFVVTRIVLLRRLTGPAKCIEGPA